MNPRGKAALMLVAAFGLGAVAGGFGVRAAQLDRVNSLMRGPTPEARKKFMAEVFRRRLSLNDEQAAQVQKVFEDHEDERRQAFEQCRPQHEALKAKMSAEIDSILTPEQRELHRQLREDMDKRHGKRGQPSPDSSAKP